MITNNFVVLHSDHGITPDQMSHIQATLSPDNGFFIARVEIPAELGTVPCGIHGPAMGDEPVPESEVTYETRFSAEDPRTWKSRLVGRPFRPVDYVQVIGTREGTKFTLYTVYGGPLAPQNPDDPTCAEPEVAREFWSAHALSRGGAK